MEVPPPSSPNLTTRRSSVPLSDLSVHLAEQYRAVMRQTLFWLQNQTYYRQRWHRILDECCVFEVGGLAQIQKLIVEVTDALDQFPYGFSPTEAQDAQRLRSRLNMLIQELVHLQKLCGAHIARSA